MAFFPENLHPFCRLRRLWLLHEPAGLDAVLRSASKKLHPFLPSLRLSVVGRDLRPATFPFVV
jgi:hypothetical protein